MPFSLNDTLEMAKSLDYGRAANAWKVLKSYHKSRRSGIARQAGLPISIAIEPTTSCNLRCPECPSGLRSFSRPTGMLEPFFFRDMIDQLSGSLAYLTFYFQGEPYLNPHFLDMVAYARSRKIYTSTSTNAHFLTNQKARETVESGLSRLIVSIDGATQETYAAYRVGGSLQKALDGAAEVIKWKKKLRAATPFVVFQFLVVGPNEHEMEAAASLARQIGADTIAYKTAQIYDYQNGSPLIPKNQKFSRYRLLPDGTYAMGHSLLNHCWKMWSSCVITWDGRLVPCCFDKDAAHSLGSLKTNSFEQIWNGAAYNDFRQKILKSRAEIDICKNCTEGGKVWG